jgi:hypothetical protein
MAQRFYNTILFPRVIDDITENKRLNYHLYRALKKAIYKPAAFYKGIILPLCEVSGLMRCMFHQKVSDGEVSNNAACTKPQSLPV